MYSQACQDEVTSPGCRCGLEQIGPLTVNLQPRARRTPKVFSNCWWWYWACSFQCTRLHHRVHPIRPKNITPLCMERCRAACTDIAHHTNPQSGRSIGPHSAQPPSLAQYTAACLGIAHHVCGARQRADTRGKHGVGEVGGASGGGEGTCRCDVPR